MGNIKINPTIVRYIRRNTGKLSYKDMSKKIKAKYNIEITGRGVKNVANFKTWINIR